MFKKENTVFILSLFLLYILPFLDGGTNFLAQILIFLGPLVLFIVGLVTKSYNFKNLPKKGLMFFSLFLMTALISTFFSQSKLFSIPEFFRKLSYFLFFILFLLTAKKQNQPIIVGFVVLAGLALSILGFLSLWPIFTKPLSGMNLIYANYGHNHLADFLILVVPFLFSNVLLGQNKKQKKWGIVFLGFFLISFAFTFSRAGFLILLFVTGFLFRLIRPQEKKAKRLCFLTVLVPVLLLVLIFTFSLNFKIKQKDELIPTTWIGRQLIKPDFDANRLEYWHQAWLGFKTRPFLGFGPGTFELVALRFQSKPNNWSSFAHNFFLQLLTEGGIFSFFFFSYFLFLCLRKTWQAIKDKRDDFFIVGGLGAILASTFHSFWDYDWQFPAIFLVFLLILANLLVIPQTKEVLEPKMKPKGWLLVMILLSLPPFIFGLSKIRGEYFLNKSAYDQALKVTFWSPTETRQIIDKLFAQNFTLGEQAAQNLMKISLEDPSMFFWLGEKYYSQTENQKAIEYYQKAIDLNPLGNFVLYRRLANLYLSEGKVDKKDEILNRFYSLIKNKISLKEVGFAKEAYLVCQQYQAEGDLPKAISWCKLARKTLPQWSFFYLEEASLLFSTGAKDEAVLVLNECLKYYWPADHCQEYLANQVKNFKLEPFGYWEKDIEKIPD